MVRSDEHAPSSTLARARGNDDRWDCAGEIWQVSTPTARELFLRCSATGRDLADQSAEAQAQRIYGCLPQILDRVGAGLGDLLWERVFFRDLIGDHDAFQTIRHAAYAQAQVSEAQLPLISCLGQPPCAAGRALELQAYVVIPKSADAVRIETIPATPTQPRAKLLEVDGYQHLYVAAFGGLRSEAQSVTDFSEQCDSMFRDAGQTMLNQQSTFLHVLRTWCYLVDIDRDYDSFNASRNQFFKAESITRLPASTGIGAGLLPPGNWCGMDLYALLNPQGATIEIMHASTLNEAPEYGSSFSRGMKLVLPGKTVLFISGTASVDEAGATVHVGDARKQIERMLLNVRELLTPQGATFADVVQGITYLKCLDDFELFNEILEQHDLTQMPNSIVVADVCRPELLCEIEMIAVLPSRGAHVESILRFGE